MFELMFCAAFTILPDYLYRRYRQGKRFGREITFFSVWFELRWGIVSCVILTVSLITMIFYFHPSTSSVTAFFRTVPILPEASGRVAEVNVGVSARVEKGDVIFRLDSSRQEAAAETARRKIAEIDSAFVAARAELQRVDGQLQEASSSLKQTVDELETKRELVRRNANVVAQREIERLEVMVSGREGGLQAATAAKRSAEIKLSTLLPAEKASAEATLAEAQVELNKTVVRAGVAGRVEQFTLRVGDVVNPMIRSAGVLIPEEAGRAVLLASFNQIEAQVMKVGMVAEATCISRPWKIIPLVVTNVQDFIAAGQFRGGEVLVEGASVTRPGTILTFLAPLYPGGLDGVTPGSSCVANAYTSNHDIIVAKETSALKGFALHIVDAVGLIHALLLRIQAFVLPVTTLVLSGH
jgi:multidrug resistance efflux pump